MAFDGLYLTAILNELKANLLNQRCDKVHQPEKDEIILSFRGRQGVKRLLLTSSADHARVHFTEEAKPNPKEAPLFTMVLRKYLQGGRLTDIRQPHGDRILILTFSTTDDMGFDSNYELIAELMGRHSNILLVRQRDQKILECIKHVGPDQNSYRVILPGADYIPPPAQDKLNPLTFEGPVTIQNPKDLAKTFFGLSQKTAEVLYDHLKRAPQAFNPDKLKAFFHQLVTDPSPTLSLKGDQPVDLNLVGYAQPREGIESKTFTSPSAALEAFMGQKDNYHRVKDRSQDILGILSLNLDRVQRKIKLLEEVLDQAKDKDRILKYGELLKANLYSLKEGQSEARVLDYYDPEAKEITIPLDRHKTLTENMQRYFKRYTKLKSSEENAKEQLILARQEEDYLSSVQDSVMRSEDPSDIEEIRRELVVAGYLRMRSGKKKKESPSKPMQFRSTEGVPIYVGKNNNQNDYLTTKFARPEDTWLHTKDYPGSHVIIRGREFTKETLLEAANLAAWYSKAQTGSKVPVDYTLVKHVKKPNGSKPGMVIYTTNKTIFIDPDAPRLERI